MADTSTVKMLEGKALTIREQLLRLCNHVPIHIGGDMSVCDVMTVIWQYAMKYDPQNPKMEERDRFILSKGHAAAVTSLNQALLGCYDMQDIFNEYATNYGRFGMHSCNLINPHVEVSTGSLGHGLPVAAGIAQALKLKGNTTSRVYVVMGDGEQAEGSIWEAALSAPQFKLGNLVGVIDRNRCSLMGYTEERMPMDDLAEKWRAFRWNVIEIDGHDMNQLIDTFDNLPDPTSDVPTLIICDTEKGHGVSFMANNPDWHMGNITEETLNKALAEVQDAYKAKWGEE
ncbi:MAG: transketolase [Clostridia bacterium]|nr:transketolase [Clostridia bacterium]